MATASSFIDAATQVADKTCMVHPGRWVVPKKQMQKVRDDILEKGLAFFNYFPNSSDLFNNVAVDGGITVTYFKKGFNGSPKCSVNNVPRGIYNINQASVLYDSYENEVYEKLIKKCGTTSIANRIIGNIGSLGSAEFGYKKTKHIDKLQITSNGLNNPIMVWANSSYGKGSRFDWYYMDKGDLDAIPTNLLATRKVMIDKKGHSITTGKGNIINNIPKIVEKNAIASGDVLFVIPQNDTDYELNLIKSLFMTRTARFLMSLTQKDLCVRGFENIPDYTYFIPMLNGALFTDEFFYKTFDFSKELIKHIESCVSEKKETTKEDK